MPIYDFSCGNGHTIERRSDVSTETIQCPICESIATRESIYREQVVFSETGYKGSRRAEIPRDERNYSKRYKLFREASEERDHTFSKAERELGRPIKAPSLWKKAKRKADRIRAGLEAPLKAVI